MTIPEAIHFGENDLVEDVLITIESESGKTLFIERFPDISFIRGSLTEIGNIKYPLINII